MNNIEDRFMVLVAFYTSWIRHFELTSEFVGSWWNGYTSSVLKSNSIEHHFWLVPVIFVNDERNHWGEWVFQSVVGVNASRVGRTFILRTKKREVPYVKRKWYSYQARVSAESHSNGNHMCRNWLEEFFYLASVMNVLGRRTQTLWYRSSPMTN